MGYVDTQLFINGKWQPPVEGKTLPVVNPSELVLLSQRAGSREVFPFSRDVF